MPPESQPAVPPVRIGLALGGGAARGFAHIGVIKALEAQGIQIDFITGTSAGSVVAALYASGMSGIELNRQALKMDEATIADWALPFGTRFGGWLKGEALEKYVNRLVKQKTIEQMRIPLGIVATDLGSGRPILFRRGNTGQAVRASCSIPGVFQPVTISGHQYVDGGLVAPVPVTYAKQMGATFVIAVNISADPSAQAVSGQASMLLQTTTIMGQSINKTELAQADVVIAPSLPFVKGSDFTARNEAILGGEQAAQAAMPLLRESCACRRRPRPRRCRRIDRRRRQATKKTAAAVFFLGSGYRADQPPYIESDLPAAFGSIRCSCSTKFSAPSLIWPLPCQSMRRAPL